MYRVATLFAGGIPYFLPLRKENGFLPNLSEIPESIAKKAKLLFINYPNNPTSAIAEKPFFEEVLSFARRYQIIVCHDAAYSEVAFDGYRPLSFFEVEGAKEIGIEFHSLSKTFNMTGWRIGFAVGCSEIISVLGRVKTNIDSLLPHLLFLFIYLCKKIWGNLVNSFGRLDLHRVFSLSSKFSLKNGYDF